VSLTAFVVSVFARKVKRGMDASGAIDNLRLTIDD